MKILIHKPTGELLKLLKKRPSGINTYIQVTPSGQHVVALRVWSLHPEEQLRLISNEKDLAEVDEFLDIL